MLWLKHSPVFKNLIKLSGISCLKQESNRTFQERAIPETFKWCNCFHSTVLWAVGYGVTFVYSSECKKKYSLHSTHMCIVLPILPGGRNAMSRSLVAHLNKGIMCTSTKLWGNSFPTHPFMSVALLNYGSRQVGSKSSLLIPNKADNLNMTSLSGLKYSYHNLDFCV